MFLLLVNNLRDSVFSFFSKKNEKYKMTTCFSIINNKMQHQNNSLTKEVNMDEECCPICLKNFDESTTVNKAVTECGHQFHSKCLIENIAYNGFACPCCRNQMAKEITSDDEYEEHSFGFDDDFDEEEQEDEEHILRGFRFFHQSLNNESYDADDIDNEDIYIGETTVLNHIRPENAPSVEFVVNKLVEQGITLEQCLKGLLFNHSEYCNVDDVIKNDHILFGKVKHIMVQYSAQ